jgi:hypothetical protein
MGWLSSAKSVENIKNLVNYVITFFI